jgi:hypothetical protein
VRKAVVLAELNTSSGLRPDAGTFLLFGQEKGTKEKAAPVSRAMARTLCCLLGLGGCGTHSVRAASASD